MADKPGIVIDPSDLIAKLNDFEAQVEGDLARVLELLLLENHVLQLGQSTGFRRGSRFGFSDYPRFLQLSETSDEVVKGEAEKEEEGDLAQ